MGQLYLNEYAKHLVDKRVCIACREGILRDNFSEIISDIKFLTRKGIKTTLFHNLPNRFANQKLLTTLEKRLPETQVTRISPEEHFYATVLAQPEAKFKVIFLERKYLIDNKGHKINTLTTGRIRNSLDDFASQIANVNFKDTMNLVCESIEAGHSERIHILPVGKNSIRQELFTVEGSGTMIADNFTETFRRVESDEDVAVVNRILAMYKRAGFLKPRGKNYVTEHRNNFFVTEIDSIIVGCVEQKIVDERTIELGALAISTRFRNQRVGVYTVTAFMETMASMGYSRFISLTLNPRLQALFAQLGFVQESPDEYSRRQSQSPEVQMFLKILD
ncbi:MAG: amino-acid N-acetyltransferase [Desulforhopalus sp.]|jgi:amino-acid N-acetyltransferase